MDKARALALCEHYRGALLDDVIPFWLEYSLDREHGGYLTLLDRDGSVYGTDKAMWLQARETWMFAKLCNTLGPRDEWLDAARLGYGFMREHGFDRDGRMFFAATRDGRPLRKRRYLFTETFGAIACAQYALAAADDEAWDVAARTFDLVVDLYRDPASRRDLAPSLTPKVIPATRATRSHAMPMILLATAQELRTVQAEPRFDRVIDDVLEDLFAFFVKDDVEALLETVGPNGERLDTPEGRCVNPGHAIETSWFLLREADHRNDSTLLQSALDILDWSLARGWDDEFGGLYAFVDLEGRPPLQLEWDMKLWWPHTEALYALLLAHALTAETRYLAWYERMHAYTFDHFADPQHGEWFGYLHRDGTLALPIKGSMWKGAFHVPRALLNALLLLRQLPTARPGGAGRLARV